MVSKLDIKFRTTQAFENSHEMRNLNSEESLYVKVFMGIQTSLGWPCFMSLVSDWRIGEVNKERKLSNEQTGKFIT